MPKNIREKLGIILEEAENLQRNDLLRMLENLIDQELELVKADQVFDTYDMNMIRGAAIKMYVDSSLSEETVGPVSRDHELKRAYCYFNAVISLLRGKGLIKFLPKFDKKSNRW